MQAEGSWGGFCEIEVDFIWGIMIEIASFKGDLQNLKSYVNEAS